MPMTDEEKSKCRKIIHGHAVAGAAGNMVPVPGVGIAVDTVTMTTMAMMLASVFGGSITEAVAKNMATAAIIATIKKQPIKVISKEISKVLPFIGQLVAPSISVAMLESAGWLLAEDLAAERDKARRKEELELGTMQGVHNFRYDNQLKLPNP